MVDICLVLLIHLKELKRTVPIFKRTAYFDVKRRSHASLWISWVAVCDPSQDDPFVEEQVFKFVMSYYCCTTILIFSCQLICSTIHL